MSTCSVTRISQLALPNWHSTTYRVFNEGGYLGLGFIDDFGFVAVWNPSAIVYLKNFWDPTNEVTVSQRLGL